MLRKQGHEVRGERTMCPLYFQPEKIHRHQELRSQIIAGGMPACQVFLQRWLPPGGIRTGKLPMIGFISAIFRKMSEVNSHAIIPLQGSDNCYRVQISFF